MKFLIRHNAIPMPSQLHQLSLVIEFLGDREGISWFQIFLAIQTGSLDEGGSSLDGAGEEDEVHREEILCFCLDDISDHDLAPLNVDKFAIAEDLSGQLEVELSI